MSQHTVSEALARHNKVFMCGVQNGSRDSEPITESKRGANISPEVFVSSDTDKGMSVRLYVLSLKLTYFDAMPVL